MSGSPARAPVAAAGLALLLCVGSGVAAETQDQASSVVPVKVLRYAEQCVTRGDADGDGTLTAKEWPQSAGNPGAVDANQDGVVSAGELAQYIADFGRHRKIRLMPASVGGLVPLPSLLPPGVAAAEQPVATGEADGPQSPDDTTAEPLDDAKRDAQKRAADRKYFVAPSRLPPGLPDWFLKRDADGDGQLTLAEYAESGSASADKEFASYDRNHDGLVTPREVVGGSAKTSRAKPPPAKDAAPQPAPATETTPPPAPAADAAPQPPTGTDAAAPPPGTEAAAAPEPATNAAPQPETPTPEKRARKRRSGD